MSQEGLSSGGFVNQLERSLDGLDPRLSVRLRLLKKQWQKDSNLRVIRSLVHRANVVMDVGANRGVYTLLLSRLVGKHGDVHSFDPFPRNVASLQRIAALRGNVTVHAAAVSDEAGYADLYVPVHGTHRIDALATLTAPTHNPFDILRVEVLCLDELFRDTQVHFIKCDVEGHERRVLSGAKGLLKKQLPALLIEIEQRHQEAGVDATFDDLLSLGYDGYFVAERGIQPLSEFDIHRHQLDLVPRGFTPYKNVVKSSYDVWEGN